MYKQLFLLLLSCCLVSQPSLANQCPDITVTSLTPLTVAAPKDWKVTVHQIDPTLFSEWNKTFLERLAANRIPPADLVDPQLVSDWREELIAKKTDPSLIDKLLENKILLYLKIQDLTVYESMVTTDKMRNPNKVETVPLESCEYGLVSKTAIQYGDSQKKLYYLETFLTRAGKWAMSENTTKIQYSLIKLTPITPQIISLATIQNDYSGWVKGNNSNFVWVKLHPDRENADPDYYATLIWYTCFHDNPNIIRGDYTKCNW